jgi:hypothetical protein
MPIIATWPSHQSCAAIQAIRSQPSSCSMHGIFVVDHPFAFAAAADVDAQAGIAVTRQIAVQPLVAASRAVMLAIGQVFQDRRVAAGGGAPQLGRQPGAVGQRDEEVLDHLDPMGEFAADLRQAVLLC